jgi:hypothetical protein
MDSHALRQIEGNIVMLEIDNHSFPAASTWSWKLSQGFEPCQGARQLFKTLN